MLAVATKQRESEGRFSVCSAGVEPATDGSSSRPLYRRLEYEHMEPPPGVDPGRPQYESGAAAVRGGVAAHRGFEPRLAHSECAVLPVRRMGNELPLLLRTPPGTRTPTLRIKSPQL